jgi:hypothetical protein
MQSYDITSKLSLTAGLRGTWKTGAQDASQLLMWVILCIS